MWTPFALRSHNIAGVDFAGAGMERIVQNFDGLNFLVVAKTWYNPTKIESGFADILSGRRPLYFSAHYPGFPAVIGGFNFFLNGPNALLASIVVSNLLLAISLYEFLHLFSKNSSLALRLSIVALFFPARMLADRIVGSNEPLFIFFILMSLISQHKGKHWLGAIWGSLAVLTRSPGIILFGAYLSQFTIDNCQLTKNWRDFGARVKAFAPYLLIPLSLVGLWGYYGWQFGSFWAYFQVGGNINLYWPFAVFASHMDWVSGIWNEDLVYLFGFLMIGIGMFWQRHRFSATAIFGVLYSVFVICVAHRDLARYSLPIVPLALLGIQSIFEYKIVRLAALILVIPIMLYAWQFVLANYQPVMDWTRLL